MHNLSDNSALFRPVVVILVLFAIYPPFFALPVAVLHARKAKFALDLVESPLVAPQFLSLPLALLPPLSAVPASWAAQEDLVAVLVQVSNSV